MKRTVIPMEVPKGVQQLVLSIQEPGIIHGFIFALREKKILSPLAVPPGNGQAQQFEEIPILFVEIDPDAPMKERKFVIMGMGEVFEAENFAFRASITSRSGAVFFLFEGVDPPDA